MSPMPPYGSYDMEITTKIFKGSWAFVYDDPDKKAKLAQDIVKIRDIYLPDRETKNELNELVSWGEGELITLRKTLRRKLKRGTIKSPDKTTAGDIAKLLEE